MNRPLSPLRPHHLAVVVFGFALAVCGCSGPSANSAQDSGGASGAPGAAASGRHHMAEALASLGLSDDQKRRIREIMKAAREQNANVTDPTQKRANFRAAMEKVQTVLTPEQRAKLQTKLAQVRAQQGTSAQ